MVRGTIAEYQYDGAKIYIGFDSGGPVGGEHFVSVSGDGYTVNRTFYFDEFHEQYARNFAEKVVDDREYREACLDETADWKQVADIYEETSRRIRNKFSERPGKLLAYTSGNSQEKARYERATGAIESLCQEVFNHIKDNIRNDELLGPDDPVIEETVAEAERIAKSLDPYTVPELAVGRRYVDQESDDDDSHCVIVEVPGVAISEYTIPGLGETVAEYNDDYPGDGPVAIVVFESALAAVDGWEDLDDEELRSAVERADIQTYSYPAARLSPVATGEE